jgi:beta-glucosidase
MSDHQDHTDDLALLTTGSGYWHTHAAPALGIPSLRMSDGPHGLRVQNDDNPDHLGLGRSMPSTCFPPAVTLAATWDPDLVREVGSALATEARALKVDVVLGPGMEIKRSPLCGRNFEYYSEDPVLTARLAGAMIDGLQSQGVAACVKHFAVNTQETERLRVSSDVDERTLREMYLRAFELTVRDANPWSIMSSYNRINGVPASANHWLLTDVLRDEWGYDGVVVSDWGAVRDPVAAVAAGNDLRMPGRPTDTRVHDALRSGSLDHAVVQRVADRLRLLADRTEPGRTGERPVIDADAHHDLVRRVAAHAAVLLHNDRHLLPLEPNAEDTVAVIGELARTPRFQGAGSSMVNPTRVVTGLDALQTRLAAEEVNVPFAAGYALRPDVDASGLLQEAVDLARGADVVLLFLGLPASYEAEGNDRTTIELPADQLALIHAVTAVNDRVVAVLSNGSAVTTAGWRERVGAILELWLTGQAHGDAAADVILGVVNPSGKLPETVPVRLEDTSAYLSFPGEAGHVAHSEGIFVGYRWFDARQMPVDHPFGHGLSYTTFDYSDLHVRVAPADADIAFTVAVTVFNSGHRRGAEVVQVYVRDRTGVLLMPDRELRAFGKIELIPGESTRVELAVRRSDLEHYHPTAGWIFPGGTLDVLVGSSSRDIRLKTTVEVPGEPYEVPLTVWSSLGEWFDHPTAGPALRSVIDSRGGVKGRMGDLLADPVSRNSALGATLIGLCEFPGFPVTGEEAQALLAEHQH